MEKLKAEIMQLRKQCEELEESKTEITRELLELKDRFQIEFSDVQAGIIDEASSREGMNRRLCELRAEVNEHIYLCIIHTIFIVFIYIFIYLYDFLVRKTSSRKCSRMGKTRTFRNRKNFFRT